MPCLASVVSFSRSLLVLYVLNGGTTGITVQHSKQLPINLTVHHLRPLQNEKRWWQDPSNCHRNELMILLVEIQKTSTHSNSVNIYRTVGTVLRRTGTIKCQTADKIILAITTETDFYVCRHYKDTSKHYINTHCGLLE